MTIMTGPTLSLGTPVARTEGSNEVTTVLFFVCLGLLGIAIGLTLANFFPMWAEVATLS